MSDNTRCTVTTKMNICIDDLCIYRDVCEDSSCSRYLSESSSQASIDAFLLFEEELYVFDFDSVDDDDGDLLSCRLFELDLINS